MDPACSFTLQVRFPASAIISRRLEINKQVVRPVDAEHGKHCNVACSKLSPDMVYFWLPKTARARATRRGCTVGIARFLGPRVWADWRRDCELPLPSARRRRQLRGAAREVQFHVPESQSGLTGHSDPTIALIPGSHPCPNTEVVLDIPAAPAFNIVTWMPERMLDSCNRVTQPVSASQYFRRSSHPGKAVP